MNKRLFLGCLVLAILALTVAPALAQDSTFTFGMVLVGPKDDHGWSQANYEAGQYITQNVPNTKMLTFESLNTADNPSATLQSVVSDMVDQGAKLIFTTSDDFQNDTDTVAKNFPNVTFIATSGDHVLAGTAPSNVGNIMGQEEWMKEIAGCAAALTTKTGSIGYLGPLINNETRRLSSSAFLGARYCWEHYKKGDPANLTFTVTWIGFWFNIPGTTLDPSEETKTFFDNGADVVMSGIDTTEALTVAGQEQQQGKDVYAVPYDYSKACDEAPQVCLGVPYYNWGPAYVDTVKAVMGGTWKQSWDWTTPDWSNINDPDTSAVGFEEGPALSADAKTDLDDFIKSLADYATNPLTPDSLALWAGPLNLQDGTALAPAGQIVKPLDVWYLPQLLQGMTGASK
ncbi:MAG TPA: BMP family ABC transporter substrate-binding protein [Phototrophicaceae bacterium]|nr:BMP family ABC transporter substrate-binding protein [Phototrophicaceae bacterium]